MYIRNKKEIIEYAQKMIDDNLTIGTSGNLSVYLSDIDKLIITPSGIAYDHMSYDDLCTMDFEGNIIEGKHKPSTEYLLHSQIYRHRKDVKAIVHTHSIYATAYSALRKPLRALHYVMADIGASHINCAEYKTFGTMDLALEAVKALGDKKACLLANHGVVTVGENIKEAYGNAQTVEFIARLYHIVGKDEDVHILSDEDIKEAMERMKGYGQ